MRYSIQSVILRQAVAGLGILCFSAPTPVTADSLNFIENTPANYDYARQTTLPGDFGAGEFTLELWVRLDDSYPIGPTTPGTPGQLVNWSTADPGPYSGWGWWFDGNFLLDGHNNGNFSNGTFSLQIHGGGRVRWDFGDGASPTGGHWAVQAWPANSTPSLLDGAWHSIACVRRWTGASSASLELWIDGVEIATETSDRRTDMRTAYWNTWPGFPSGESGWFWGSEKQAAIGSNGVTQYEDYKGLLDEVRFWSRAKTSQELTAHWAAPLIGDEPGLDGWYRFDEGTGTTSCSAVSAADCWTLVNSSSSSWSSEDAPLTSGTNPDYIYVDFGAPSGGNGTAFAPFNTLSQSLTAAAPGATIEIAPGSTPETIQILAPLQLINGNGTAGPTRIGASPSRFSASTPLRAGFVSDSSK